MFMKRMLAACCLVFVLSSALPAFAEDPVLESFSPAPSQDTAPVAGEWQPGSEPSPAPVQEAPQPLVLIQGSNLPASLSAGQQAQVTVTVENVNGQEMLSPILTLSPSDSIVILGGSSSFPLENIAQGQTRSATFTIKATDPISSPAQNLGAEVRFNYNNNVSTLQATVSDRIPLNVQMKAPAKATQPSLVVTRAALQPVSPGQDFQVTVSLKNVGDAAAENTVASVSTPEGLTLKNDNTTFVLGKIAPGGTGTLTLSLKAASQLANSMESLGLDLKYSYNSGEGIAQGSLSDRINIPTTPSASSGAAAPNLIVDNFDYGKNPVGAGNQFPLTFTLQNTGSLQVENLVVTLDGGDSFTISGGTNTFYYSKIAGNGKQKQTVQLQALSTAKTGAQGVNINCKYEYLEGGKRTPASTDIRLSVPVVQPDRFQVNAPTLPEFIYAGEEVSLALNYVNKGKSEVNNVEAVLEGNVDSPAKTQYLGNFESGKSGSIGFVFTPAQAGKTPVTLKINYEDGNQEIHTLTFPLTLEVQPPQEVDFEDMDLPAEKGPFPVLPLVLGVGVLVVLTGGAVLWKKKKSAAPAAAPQEDVWEDWEEESAFDQPLSQVEGSFQ